MLFTKLAGPRADHLCALHFPPHVAEKIRANQMPAIRVRIDLSAAFAWSEDSGRGLILPHRLWRLRMNDAGSYIDGENRCSS